MASDKKKAVDKLAAKTSTYSYDKAESGYSANNAQANINDWNSALYGGLTNKGGDYYKSDGTKVYTGYDNNGLAHYSTSKSGLSNILSGYNEKGTSATYSLGGVNYVPIQEEQPVASSYSPSVGYTTIAFDKDKYIDNLFKQYSAVADQAYIAGENTANKTKQQQLNDLITRYNTTRGTYDNTLSSAKDKLASTLSNISKSGFSALQQNRENAASRGLSSSGLMQALDQSVISDINSDRANAEMQYNADVNQIRQNVATLVDNYGLDKETANNIYNSSVEALTQQKYSAYKEGIYKANNQGDEYQWKTDSFNATAANDATKLEAQLKQAWEEAKLSAATTKEVAQKQIEASWREANLSADTQKELKRLDINTQLELAKFSAEAQKQIAKISGSYSLGAAKAAAQLELEAAKWNMDFSGVMGTMTTFAEENGWNGEQLGKAFQAVTNYSNGGISKEELMKIFESSNDSYSYKGSGRASATSGR